MQPFIDTILDYPYEDGPLLVLADWLMDRGDSRGELLASLPKIVETIRALPVVQATLVDLITLSIKIKQVRLYNYFRARYTPTLSGKTIQDQHHDKTLRQCVIAGLLRSLFLISQGMMFDIQNNGIALMNKVEESSATLLAGWAAVDSLSPAANTIIIAGDYFSRCDHITVGWQYSLAQHILRGDYEGFH